MSFINPTLQDPRRVLTPAQIRHLRRLDKFGGASKVAGGWVIGGCFHGYRALYGLVRLGLAEQVFRDGRHKLVLSPSGRTVLLLLARPAPPPGDLFASAR